jgi:hypothetical protein
MLKKIRLNCCVKIDGRVGVVKNRAEFVAANLLFVVPNRNRARKVYSLSALLREIVA